MFVLLGDKKELNEMWEKLIENATKIEEREISITYKTTSQIAKEKLIRYKLDDETNIIYRTGSSSGEETINIYSKKPYINKTIHIKG